MATKNIPFNKEITIDLIENTTYYYKFLGRKAKRFINKGECITETVLYEKYDVRVGENLKAYLKFGNIKIGLKVISLNNTKIGNRIRVFNKDSGKVFEGVLNENREVEININ
ncbi:MAG: flagella basal body P-ring formation protein FlgA [Elusimicrobiales bacterium]|nr:flagella basal body P-ring formation protein FlgA [Elusimicrobiales bacterium]